MRPSSTRRSTPSSATVVPKALRRPRASMVAMASALLLGRLQQLLRLQAQPLNGCVDPRPLLGKKFLALALEQLVARALPDEHPQTALLLDQLLVDQFLVALQNRDRIEPILGRDIADRWKRIAFLEDAIEDQSHHPVPELSVDWLAVVPLTLHGCIPHVLVL